MRILAAFASKPWKHNAVILFSSQHLPLFAWASREIFLRLPIVISSGRSNLWFLEPPTSTWIDRVASLEYSSFSVTLLLFLVADKRLYKRLCPSVGWLVGPWWSSWKVWKRAFPPLPTRPRLVLAVYPALFFFYLRLRISWRGSLPSASRSVYPSVRHFNPTANWMID